jgi:hypothetical protein
MLRRTCRFEWPSWAPESLFSPSPPESLFSPSPPESLFSPSPTAGVPSLLPVLERKEWSSKMRGNSPASRPTDGRVAKRKGPVKECPVKECPHCYRKLTNLGRHIRRCARHNRMKCDVTNPPGRSIHSCADGATFGSVTCFHET